MKYLANLVISILGAVTLVACGSREVPPIEGLLIDETAFPSGWTISQSGPSPSAPALWGGKSYIDSAELTFSAAGGVAIQRIFRFEKYSEAAIEFQNSKSWDFPEAEHISEWTVPSDLNYRGTADEYYYACSYLGNLSWPNCVFIARYGEYFLHFKTPLLPGYMTIQDFEAILLSIDSKMYLMQ
jgi:hypothetical protein